MQNESSRNALKTFIRAYSLGWAITTAPPIISATFKALLIAKNKRSIGSIEKAIAHIIPQLLKKSVLQNGLPLLLGLSFSGHQLLIRYHKIAVFLSAFVSMSTVRRLFPQTKTLDLTFFVFVRAIDVFAHRLYISPTVRRRVPEWTLEYGNIAVFMLASTEILFSWFYEPHRLPKSYRNWITHMSGIDTRLLEALRAIRKGEWIYGASSFLDKDTGLSHLLGDYCTRLGLPRHLGDPMTGRIACTLVHEGKPYGCEANVLLRFYRGFIKIFPVYLSVHLFPPLFFKTSKLFHNPGPILSHVLFASIRSSSFLATYIAIIWYSICLVRTRIGYQLLGINQSKLDNTLAPLIGSMLCGLSLLIESKHRRGEMTLYVLPRALYSFTERILSPYQKGRWWEHRTAEFIESFTFALSIMVVVDTVYKNRQLVRPSSRAVLSWILQIKSTSGRSTPVEDMDTSRTEEDEEEGGLILRKKTV